MQKAFEKIVERLEELKKIEKERPDSCDEDGIQDGEDIYDDGRSQGRYEQTVRIIKIVNQVAEEYGKDNNVHSNEEVCEWERNYQFFSDKYRVETECGYTFYDLHHTKHFEYCPYCGKKIKVVE